MRPPCLRVLRIVQCMIDFVRRTKFDSYQTRSPPFGRLKVSKEDATAARRRRVAVTLAITDENQHPEDNRH